GSTAPAGARKRCASLADRAGVDAHSARARSREVCRHAGVDPVRGGMANRFPPPLARTEALVLGALLVLAAALRFHGLGWGLPDVYEEAYPFKKAWDMWGFGPMRRFDLDPHFFKYPSLTLYLQMLGQALTFGLL